MGCAFRAIMAYAIWWKKSRFKAEPSLIEIDVHSSLYARLYNTSGSISEEIQLRGCEVRRVRGGRTSIDNADSISEERTEERDYRAPVPFSAEWSCGHQLFAWSAISLVHGALYGLAWSTQLPTDIDQIIWKVCIGMVVVIGPVTVHSMDVLWNKGYTPLISLGLQKRSIHRIYKTLLFFFIFARLCMVVETFRELPYLSPDAFILASWSTYLPQFS